MSKPTEADMQILKDQISDLTNKLEKRDEQLRAVRKEKESMVSQTDFAAVEQERDERIKEKDARISTVESERNEKNAEVIELQGKLGESDATVTEHEACIQHVRDKAIAFYAKVRGVDVDDESDALFVGRKKILQESNSLPYLIEVFEQYQKDYYAAETEFGGLTTKSKREDDTPRPGHVNQNNFDF